MPGLALKISRVTTFLLFGASLLLHWFQVPIGIHEKSHGGYALDFEQPHSTLFFKIFVLVVVLCAVLITWRFRRSGSAEWLNPFVTAGGILVLATAIVYPAVTMQRCAEVSAHAAWLNQENFSMIVSVGDSFTSQEFYYQSGEPEVQINQVLPRAFQAIPTPSIQAAPDVHLTKLQHMFIWLGLSPDFCQFVTWGWFCSVIGALLLVVLFLPLRGNWASSSADRKSLYVMVEIFAGGGALVCLLCLMPIMEAGQELARAQNSADEGRYSEAIRYLDLAEKWVPVLAFHTDLIYQRGWLEEKVGLNSPVRQIYSAIRDEEEGFMERAMREYFQLLTPDTPKPVWGEAFRGALRLTIKDYNSGMIGRAAAWLKQLTLIDPSSVKANYALQLADLRCFRKTELEQDVDKFEALYSCFESPEKSPLVAAAHRRLSDLEYDCRDLTKLGDEMRAAVTPLTQ